MIYSEEHAVALRRTMACCQCLEYCLVNLAETDVFRIPNHGKFQRNSIDNCGLVKGLGMVLDSWAIGDLKCGTKGTTGKLHFSTNNNATIRFLKKIKLGMMQQTCQRWFDMSFSLAHLTSVTHPAGLSPGGRTFRLWTVCCQTCRLSVSHETHAPARCPRVSCRRPFRWIRPPLREPGQKYRTGLRQVDYICRRYPHLPPMALCLECFRSGQSSTKSRTE